MSYGHTQAQQACSPNRPVGEIRGAGITIGEMERGLNVAPQEVREIDREHSDLMRELEALNATVNHMVSRLGPVIRNVPATAEMEKPVPLPGCYSELGSAIREATERVRSCVSRLRETIDSLAV